MRNVFIDEHLEQSFQEKGYVVLPFIPQEEVELLKAEFDRLLMKSGGNIKPEDVGLAQDVEISYDFTFIDKNIEYKQEVFDLITSRFKPYYEKVLDSYRPLIANYIRKKSGGGEVPLHQNWAFADEMICSTVSIWCPLINSTVANGTLQVIPGSHKKFGKIRGPKIPWELEAIGNDLICQYMVPLEVPAGHAVILDDSILHYSANNSLDQLRLAIQLILMPAELPSIHYHMHTDNDKNSVEVLEVDAPFYMSFNPWKEPVDFISRGFVPFQFKSLSLDEYKHRMAGKRFDDPIQMGLLAKLKKVFGALQS